METVKIRCKSLCVGDWVANRNGSPMQIVAVDEDNAYAYEGNEERPWIFGDYEGREPEPIILTPEILEKNGWYFGLTSDEEDAEYCLDGCHYNRHWTCDEGAGSISLIFPNDADGGELIIDDQSFNRLLKLVFCDTLHVHELQRALRLCGLNELADNFKI